MNETWELLSLSHPIKACRTYLALFGFRTFFIFYKEKYYETKLLLSGKRIFLPFINKIYLDKRSYNR